MTLVCKLLACLPSGLSDRLGRDRRAVTALEYGLIAAAVVAVGIVGFGALEGDLSNKFNTIADQLS